MALQRVSRRAKWLLAILVVATSIAIVNASVFVFYPINVSLQGQAPPIVFSTGKNANQADLWGNTIGVTLDSTNTTLTLTLHPTWRTNLYKNISLIVNLDTTRTYYIKFNVTSPFTNAKITSAILYIKNLAGTTTYGTVNLLTSGLQPNSWISISNNPSKLRLDLIVIYTPANTDTPNSAAPNDSCTIQLVYSPQNAENPSP